MADWYRQDEEQRTRGYGSGDEGYRQQGRSSSRDRGMMERGSDEVRSWFGDEEAERRRQRDESRQGARNDGDWQRPRQGAGGTSSWRDRGDGGERGFRDRESQQSRAGLYRPATFTYTEIWAIPGPYAGQGPKGYQRSDDRIHEEVCERLTQHGNIAAENIEVSVSNGEVTLRGTVENRDMKRTAEDVAESVSGVRDVRNELRATPSANNQTEQQQQQQQSFQSGEKTSSDSKRDRAERNRMPS